MKRVEVLGAHLAWESSRCASTKTFQVEQHETSSSTVTTSSPEKYTMLPDQLPTKDETMMRKMISMLENKTVEPQRRALFESLPGPAKEFGFENAMLAVQRAAKSGKLHNFWNEWAKKVGNDGTAGHNFLFVTTITPMGAPPYVDYMVVIGHPEDAARLARVHVKKNDTYGIAFLGNGVLSTVSNESWKEQREHLVESFLPMASLSKVLPVSQERARVGKQRMDEMCQGGEASVDINEFFLFETMAQLQLAMFGETPDYMEEINISLRQSFKDALNIQASPAEAIVLRTKARKKVHQYSNNLVSRAKVAPLVGPSEAFEESSRCVQGPLTARIADLCPFGNEDPKIQRDCASTFQFAGHDTTANLLTFIIYHLCMHPEFYARLQKEVDDFMEKYGESGYSYENMSELTFMKRVITETLRLTPSVPNGSFRQIQFDERVHGPNGTTVTLPKGTPFVVPVWNTHHNTSLWGADAEKFNPDRDFLDDELAHYSPSSHRFFPFMPAPRGCLGQLFAMMEARTILLQMLYNFKFELTEEAKKQNFDDLTVNIGTLQPKEGLFVHAIPRKM